MESGGAYYLLPVLGNTDVLSTRLTVPTRNRVRKAIVESILEVICVIGSLRS